MSRYKEKHPWFQLIGGHKNDTVTNPFTMAHIVSICTTKQSTGEYRIFINSP